MGDFCRKPKRPLQISAPVGQEALGGLGVHPFLGQRPQDQTKPQWESIGHQQGPAATRVPYRLLPAPLPDPCSQAGLLPRWLPPPPQDQAQLSGGHPLARGFSPSPGGFAWQCQSGLSPPGSLRIRLPPRPNPAVLSPCQGAVGEGRIWLLGLMALGRALRGDVGSSLRPTASCPPRGAGICKLLCL